MKKRRKKLCGLFVQEDDLIELVSDDEESQPSVHDTKTPNCLVQLYVMFLFIWQTLFQVSDTGMNILLLFITKFLSLVPSAQNFIDQLPSTIAAARKLVGINCDNFSKYASCPSCHTVYPFRLVQAYVIR